MFLQFDQGNDDPDVMQLPAVSLAIPNELSRGKHKIRFACREAASMRVFTPDRQDVHLEPQGALSVGIPDGCRVVTIKLESDQLSPGVPVSPISACISEL